MKANNGELRKPTNGEREQFEKTDEQLDSVRKKEAEEAKKKVSNIELIKKTFMKISDVDVDDAAWLKAFADKYTSKHQFLAIKVIRTVMERLDPTLLNKITQLEQRIEKIENLIMQEETEEGEQVKLPKGQGKHRRVRDLRKRYRELTGTDIAEDVTLEQLEKMINLAEDTMNDEIDKDMKEVDKK